MNVLVTITHPAHVHFFRNAIYEWKKNDHKVCIAARDKDLTLSLLDEYCLTYTCLSNARPGVIGLALELIEHESKLVQIAKKFKPDVMVSIGGTFQVHVAKMLGIRSIVFSDTEIATVANRITYPFADVICTPLCYRDDWGKKHVRYSGYQELAYLYPNYFTPNPHVLEESNIQPNHPFFLIRFISWGAAHDLGHSGFTLEGKRDLIKYLREFGRVIITSESVVPPEFEPYQMQVSPTKIHDLLYYSSLYIGEGGTMASEAAVLGVPSIFVSTLSAGTFEELRDEYGLMFVTSDENIAIKRASEWVNGPDVKLEWQAKRQRMLRDKIDVTAWIVEYVENCVKSKYEGWKV